MGLGFGLFVFGEFGGFGWLCDLGLLLWLGEVVETLGGALGREEFGGWQFGTGVGAQNAMAGLHFSKIKFNVNGLILCYFGVLKFG